MSTVALVPQPPELSGAGGGGAKQCRRARRSGTPPTDATSTGTTPTRAKASGTTTTDAKPATRTPTGRPLTGATMTGATMTGATTAGTTLAGTTLAGTTLAGTTLAGTTLAGTTTGRMPVRSCAAVELGWQPVADRPPLRLTRRGRALVAALTVLVFGAAVLVLGLRAAGALTDGPRFSETTLVQVGAGQTLWSIAAETNPDQDPRIVIDEIVKLNGLRNAGDVAPGQTLIVPEP